MAELKVYDVEINNMRTTVKLSDADAKKRGLTEKDLAKPASKGRAAANKGRSPGGNKAPSDDDAAKAAADKAAAENS